MKKLYEGNINKNFFSFSLPLVLSALLSKGFEIINTIMAGTLIGDSAISAIGSTAPFVSFVSSFFWGYGVGFSVYVAMLFGSKNYKKMYNVIKVNILLVSGLIIIISSICIVFHNKLFDALNIESIIRKDAATYFILYMSGLVFFNFNLCGLYISNAISISKIPLIASAITNILNISGIFVSVKFFKLGVLGIGISTVFSAATASLFYIFRLTRIFSDLGLTVKGLYFDKRELYNSAVYALPSMIQQSAMYVCTALVSPLTNLCGANAIAGYTVGMRLYDLNAGVYQNANKTVSSYIAQCIGAKKADLIKKGIKKGLVQTFLFLAPFLSVTVLGADIISKIMLDNTEAIYYSNIFMRYCMIFVVFNVLNNLFHAVFRCSGAGKYLVISTLIYAAARYGFSYLLFPKYEMYGIYAGVVLSWITEAVFGIIIYFSGRWKKAIKY